MKISSEFHVSLLHIHIFKKFYQKYDKKKFGRKITKKNIYFIVTLNYKTRMKKRRKETRKKCI